MGSVVKLDLKPTTWQQIGFQSNRHDRARRTGWVVFDGQDMDINDNSMLGKVIFDAFAAGGDGGSNFFHHDDDDLPSQIFAARCQ